MSHTTHPGYIAGSELPGLAFTFRDDDGEPYDFSAGWTFTVLFAPDLGYEAALVKDDQDEFTGSAAAPNLTTDWTVDDLELDIGIYRGQVVALREVDDKELKGEFFLPITRKITEPDS